MKNLVLKNHYKEHLSTKFYSLVKPMEVKREEIVLLNKKLSEELGINSLDLEQHSGYFSGRELPPGALPLAQAYSGHQFGFYTRLGDGRAILLGEWEDEEGELWDIQLKGAGRTPYSRGGDGKAALAPMLREYLVSETMDALGIPTTRSLALVLTGIPVFRQQKLHGAMLTRVAKSHLRVGTFQYALEAGGETALKELADYAIARHYPEVLETKKPYFFFLVKIIEKQAKLLSLWMAYGFIHGVMNTDNMSISGETIDYGPCAFMDYYDPETVYSSIDTRGRYAYGNQPTIAQWNLTRLAEALLPLLTKEGSSIDEIETQLMEFKKIYREFYYSKMGMKLGLIEKKEGDRKLIKDLLHWMLEKRRDYTNTFKDLTLEDFSDEVYRDDAFLTWLKTWQERRELESSTKEESLRLMKKHNPHIIARNHKVEEVLRRAEEGDMEPYKEYLRLLEDPYNYEQTLDSGFLRPMTLEELKKYQTFCGT